MGPRVGRLQVAIMVVALPRLASSQTEVLQAPTEVETTAIEAKVDDEKAVAIRVEGAQAECPSSMEFFRRLQQRAPGVRLTRSGEPGWVFAVRFARADGGVFNGQLRVHDLAGGVLVREVGGARCAEVADALALVGAIALRPEILDNGEGARATAPERPPVPASAPLPLAPVATEASAWGLFVRGFGSTRTDVFPVPLYGIGMGVEVAREGTTVWRPSFGFASAATFRATANTDNIVANTALTGQLFFGQFSASPLALRTGVLELRPYVAFELGMLAASGSGTGFTVERQSNELWLAIALLAQANVELGSHWRVGAHVGADIHPIRYNFQITPLDVYLSGIVGLSVGLSICFRLN
jgi:hypothetical protein